MKEMKKEAEEGREEEKSKVKWYFSVCLTPTSFIFRSLLKTHTPSLFSFFGHEKSGIMQTMLLIFLFSSPSSLIYFWMFSGEWTFYSAFQSTLPSYFPFNASLSLITDYMPVFGSIHRPSNHLALIFVFFLSPPSPPLFLSPSLFNFYIIEWLV